jgi:ribose-phosphate pyrophosphokinase
MTELVLSRSEVHGFFESEAAARRLADLLEVPYLPIQVRHFPDGESLVTAAASSGHAIVYRSLNDPNAKLVELLLAASALRDRGASRLTLVAPYLPYMRQDKAFASGQAVSQQVIGTLLAQSFDAFVTAAPHLHRTHSLSAVFAGKPALSVDPAPLIAAALRGSATAASSLLLGPDEESEPPLRALAAASGLNFAVAAKRRLGDHEVDLQLPKSVDWRGRHIIIVDDIAATGGTLMMAARAALAAGAESVEAFVCHVPAPLPLEKLMQAGIRRLRSADSIAHATNAVTLAPLLAAAVRQLPAMPPQSSNQAN